MSARPGARAESPEERLEKTVEMGFLYDLYGQLLTERQRQFFALYFLDDLSLGEIAAQFRVSRQAVYDILRRSQRTLERVEARLGLAAERRRLTRQVDALRELARRLQDVLTRPDGRGAEARSLAAELRLGLEALAPWGAAVPGEEAGDGLRASD